MKYAWALYADGKTSVTFDKASYSLLRILAEKDGRSMSAEMRFLVKERAEELGVKA